MQSTTSLQEIVTQTLPRSEACPVCASPYTAYVRDVPTTRTLRHIPLFVCMKCRSLWNPSGWQEDDELRRVALKWGISVEERNRQAGRLLFEMLAAKGVKPRQVLEIGCGIGTMVALAEEMGMSAIGFDVNDVAGDYARSLGRNVRSGFWTPEIELPRPDLILCISVLEHLDQPRELLRALCDAALSAGAALYISVPTVDEPRWHHILNPDPKAFNTPFYDNDEHVTHFSTEGLISVLREFGMGEVTVSPVAIWKGVLAKPPAS